MPKSAKKSPTKKTATSKTAPKKATKKPAAIAGMFFFGLAAAIIVFVIVAKVVVVDGCASPCGESDEICPTVCVKETLWDRISKSMRKLLAKKEDDDKRVSLTRSEYTIHSAGQYGDITIYVDNNNKVSVEYNEVIMCVTTPCPQPRIKSEVYFSEENMKIVYNFLRRLQDDENYDDLSYQDKRILASMMLDQEDKIKEYEIAYYVNNVYYSIKDTSGEITITYQDRKNAIDVDLTPETEEDINAIKMFIHKYCAWKDNYIVYMYPKDLASNADRTLINRILHLEDEAE